MNWRLLIASLLVCGNAMLLPRICRVRSARRPTIGFLQRYSTHQDLHPLLTPILRPLTEARHNFILASNQPPSEFPLWMQETATNFRAANIMHTMHLAQLGASLKRGRPQEHWYQSCLGNIKAHIMSPTQRLLLTEYVMHLDITTFAMDYAAERAFVQYIEKNLLAMEEAREIEFYELFMQHYRSTADERQRVRALESLSQLDLYYILGIGWKRMQKSAVASIEGMSDPVFDSMVQLWMDAGDSGDHGQSLEQLLAQRMAFFWKNYVESFSEPTRQKYAHFATMLFQHLDEVREISMHCHQNSAKE